MERLEMRRLIVKFYLLLLGALFNATPGDIHKNPWVTQIFLKKALNSTQGKEVLTAWLQRLY